ncbi:MAG: hypothetical protein MZV63_50450 [Marinilabiliales bacterium]|nr:hypothetical protein [Marinilabiliales bacterium]
MLYGYFVVRKKAHQSLMFILFLIVFLVNFAGNNSLESQPGQDLFVFFSLFYGYFYPRSEKRTRVHLLTLVSVPLSTIRLSVC